MIGRRIVLLLALAICCAQVLASGLRQTPQAPFSARTDAVVVDVTVRQGQTNVTDLTASEFRVLDNGVPQIVQLVAASSVPLDLTVLNDAGDADSLVQRAWFSTDVKAVADLLRPGDRLGILAAATHSRQLLPLTPVPMTVLPAMPLGGEPRVVDCLAEALMIPGMAGRRHVLIVQTTGLDMVSATVPARLPYLAMRCDAFVDLALTGRFQNPVMDALLDTARLTGGDAFKAVNVQDAVRQLLASAEHTYLLTYVATGVAHQGAHTITVTVTRPGTFTIGARHGYVDQ